MLTPAADNAVPKTSKKGTARAVVDTQGGVSFGGKVESKEHAFRYQITVINVTLSCCVKDATGTPRDARVKWKVCMWGIQVALFGRGRGASRSGKVGRNLVLWCTTRFHTHAS